MQGTTFLAAAAAIAEPASAEPTKTTSAVFGCATIAWPAVTPWPAMTLTRPRGAPPASQSAPSTSVLSGVSSDGLMTTPLPVQIAGAICQPPVKSGAFQGVICATTPTGSLRV
ncbi:hypothetical protein D9M68_538420 [compost metagenome]